MEYIHKKQSGGAGQFAKVRLSVEPLEAGKGREIENLIKGGAIPKEYTRCRKRSRRCSRQWYPGRFSNNRLQSNLDGPIMMSTPVF